MSTPFERIIDLMDAEAHKNREAFAKGLELMNEQAAEIHRLRLLLVRKSKALAFLANKITDNDLLADYACVEAAATEPA